MISLISSEFSFIYIFHQLFKNTKKKRCLLFGTSSSISTEKIKAKETLPSHVI